ncbi:DNA-binding domain-containing protein [Sphingomonas sp.]|uniref:HvfC/BufC N-terminal domain-containing protein n=1 Tax=Sphingomonas sp. TaxID=28214 RepID=UPI000DB21FA9|nr:DNA-binding domain-containing protein [Sphingomonas sp.]PZU06117.1 MAG: DUF2063 domain-containing protein [Sphingomonas sp.]
MNLLAFQRDFAAALRDTADDGVSIGLAIYRNNYQASLAACLEDTFARTRAWIGDKTFANAVARHVDRVPPHSWTLDAYPQGFSETLGIMFPDDPEIAELAWLECALAEAFVGPDTLPVSEARLAIADWDRAVLQFTTTLDMRDMFTNAPDLLSAMTAGNTPPAAEMLTDPGVLLVWRRDYVSRFRVADIREAQAIRLARSGETFASLCASLVDEFGQQDGVRFAGEMLGRWLRDGLITGL